MYLTRLPDTIKVKGITMARVECSCSTDTMERKIKAICKRNGINYYAVQALSRNLRTRTDLRGKPYKPSRWIYVDATKIDVVHEKLKIR